MDVLLLHFWHQCEVASDFLPQVHLVEDVQEQERRVVPHTDHMEDIDAVVLGTDDVKAFRKLGPQQDAPNDEAEVKDRDHQRSRSCALSPAREYRERYECHD